MKVGGLLTVVAALTVLTACGPVNDPQGGNPSNSSSPFPPRPVTLSLDNVDPCGMLVAEQRIALGIRRATLGEVPVDGRPSPICTFLGDAEADYNVQTISADISGAANGPGTSITQVNGFGAVQNIPAEASAARPTCQVSVDAASGMSIRVQANSSESPPSVGMDELCRRATEVASMVMTTVVATAAR